jgi:inhibitor of KinA
MNWVAYGPDALLIQFADAVGEEAFIRGRAITMRLEQNPPAGLVDFVPAFTTVLLQFGTPVDATMASDLIGQLEAAVQLAAPPAPIKEIPVVYDGPDLDRVAAHNQLTIEQVKELHAAPIYKVYMLGFTPGFPYLGDLDARLHTPRLASPRTRVPAGAVAIGGEHTGIYSVDSPGGWNIIGHTSTKLFDPKRPRETNDPRSMFYLHQGDRIRFVPARRT